MRINVSLKGDTVKPIAGPNDCPNDTQGPELGVEDDNEDEVRDEAADEVSNQEMYRFLNKHRTAKIIIIIDTHCLKETEGLIYTGTDPESYRACSLKEVHTQ